MAKSLLHTLPLSALIAVGLVLTSTMPGLVAEVRKDPHASSAQMNNEGVEALQAGRFAEAVSKFEQALELEPTYKLAQENLVASADKAAQALESKPREAIRFIHKVVFYAPDNRAALDTLNRLIRAVNRDPGSFEDRLALAQESRTTGDTIGEVVEYEAALKLKKDASISSDPTLAWVITSLSEALKKVKRPGAALSGQSGSAAGSVSSHGQPAGQESGRVGTTAGAVNPESVWPPDPILIGDATEVFGRASERGSGSTNPETWKLTDQGDRLYSQELFKQALAVYKEALSVSRSSVAGRGGEDKCLSGIGDCLFKLGELIEAGAYYRQAHSVCERTFGPEHHLCGKAMFSVGIVDFQLGRYAEAEAQFRRAEEIWQKSLGADSPEVALAIARRGLVSFKRRNYADAEKSLEIAARLWLVHPTAQSYYAGMALANAALCKAALGELADAEQTFLEARKTLESCLPFSRVPLIQTLRAEAVCLRRDNREVLASPLEARANELEAAGGPGAAGLQAGASTQPAEVNYKPFMADLQRKIQSVWRPPRGYESKRVWVKFKAHADGKVSEAHILQTSGSDVADKEALRALARATPLPRLPYGAPEAVDIEFTFTYNIAGAGQRR